MRSTMRPSPASIAASSGAAFARHREGRERHHAVGLDLEQALHHAAGLTQAHLAVEHEEAREAVLADAEVGVGPASPFGHRAADTVSAVGLERVRRWRIARTEPGRS